VNYYSTTDWFTCQTVVNPTDDLFGDIPGEVIASIPEVEEQQSVKKGEAVMQEKVKDVKKKSTCHLVLYHGKKRRSSEMVQLNAFKKSMIGIGSTECL
jgi:hypothetical protein